VNVFFPIETTFLRERESELYTLCVEIRVRIGMCVNMKNDKA
jgi:hypothetical protein